MTPEEIADAANVPPASHKIERYPRSWKYSITSLGFKMSNSITSMPFDARSFWKLLLAPLCVTTIVDASDWSQRFASSGRSRVCVITILRGMCPPPCLAVSFGSDFLKNKISTLLTIFTSETYFLYNQKGIDNEKLSYSLSLRAVFPPTTTASLLPRNSKTRLLDILLLIHAEWPLLAAIFPVWVHLKFYYHKFLEAYKNFIILENGIHTFSSWYGNEEVMKWGLHWAKLTIKSHSILQNREGGPRYSSTNQRSIY